ncbi:hypothetical protein [Streptomyces xanthochromogenes]
MSSPSAACTGRVGSSPAGVSGSALPPARGRDHRTSWISAISRSPAGERLAAPLVAAVKDSESPVRGAARAGAGTTPTAVTAPAAPAAAARS